MTTKEQLHAEIENLCEDRLDELHDIVKRFVQSQSTNGKLGIMAKLRNITVVAPADFAENLDLYTSGEKRVEDNLH